MNLPDESMDLDIALGGTRPHRLCGVLSQDALPRPVEVLIVMSSWDLVPQIAAQLVEGPWVDCERVCLTGEDAAELYLQRATVFRHRDRE